MTLVPWYSETSKLLSGNAAGEVVFDRDGEFADVRAAADAVSRLPADTRMP
jgi:hypothetical protein